MSHQVTRKVALVGKTVCFDTGGYNLKVLFLISWIQTTPALHLHLHLLCLRKHRLITGQAWEQATPDGCAERQAQSTGGAMPRTTPCKGCTGSKVLHTLHSIRGCDIALLQVEGGIELMKGDMAGGAAVLGAAEAISQIQPEGLEVGSFTNPAMARSCQMIVCTESEPGFAVSPTHERG